jgi:hypothetical protein
MAMQDNLSWRAVFRPGHSDSYFDLHPRAPFQVDAEDFNAVNAWWLAELCRLIYRKDRHPSDHYSNRVSRDHILKMVALREVRYLRYPYAQGALIKTLPNAADPFAVLVFRGTSGNIDAWMPNFQLIQTPWYQDGMVHSGYKRIFDDIWPELCDLLLDLDCPLYYTGHSLGAALATLTASIYPPKALYTFGSPRVGNIAFTETLRHINIYRVVNTHDIVSAIPPSIGPLTFSHAGRVHYLYPPNASESTRRRRTLLSLWRFLIRTFNWRYAPRFLAEHAPVNYTTRLKTT